MCFLVEAGIVRQPEIQGNKAGQRPLRPVLRRGEIGGNLDLILLKDALLTAALATGCDGIHPGYGFLSENPDFADRMALLVRHNLELNVPGIDHQLLQIELPVAEAGHSSSISSR